MPPMSCSHSKTTPLPIPGTGGIVLVELSQAIPAGTTGTLPVLFETNGVTKNVTTYNGANVTVSDIPGTGVFQLFYDKQTDTLQLMTGAV